MGEISSMSVVGDLAVVSSIPAVPETSVGFAGTVAVVRFVVETVVAGTGVVPI